MGQIFKYRRPNGKCPADEILCGCDPGTRKKFKGAFDAIANQTGSSYCNNQRFKPLQREGKPLWEFKEFRYRLYCHRICIGPFAKIILLSGCQKQGKGKRETNEIARAKELLIEYINQGRN